MKKIISFLVLCSTLVTMAWAQYFTLSFTGISDSGRYCQVSDVVVQNISKGWQQVLHYPDTVLFLGTSTEGIDAVGGAFDYRMGQNPFDGRTSIAISVPKAGASLLRLYDLQGRLLAEQTAEMGVGFNQFDIEVAQPGVAILMVSTQQGSMALKLVSQGGVGGNSIARGGTMAQPKAKAAAAGAFDIGDQMSYYGVWNHDGDDLYSDTIIRYQLESEQMSLLFHEPVALESLIPEGAIVGLFSVAADRQIVFSRGNLQYQASTDTWRFAPNQYDYLAHENRYMCDTNSHWMDSFAWGTSGYHDPSDSSNVNYMPWDNDQEGIVDDSYNKWGYGPSTNMLFPDLTDKGEQYDWGVHNPISNGGNEARIWRLLTYDEIYYLAFERPNHSNLMGGAKVNLGDAEVNGWILLPDNWVAPSGISFNPGIMGFPSANTYSIAELALMEAAGAVFLPACGSTGSQGNTVWDLNTKACYVTSTHSDKEACWGFFFSANEVCEMRSVNRKYGRPVRLVHEVSVAKKD